MFWLMKANMAFICWNWFLLGLILSERKYKILISDKSVTIFHATDLQEVWFFFLPISRSSLFVSISPLKLLHRFCKSLKVFRTQCLYSCALYQEIPIREFVLFWTQNFGHTNILNIHVGSNEKFESKTNWCTECC